MSDIAPIPPIPLSDPARDGYNAKYAAAIELYDSGYRGQHREGKAPNLKADYYRELAIVKQKRKQAISQGEQDSERPIEPE